MPLEYRSQVPMSENLEQTLEILKASLLVKPKDPYKRCKLGLTYWKLGQNEAAARELEKAASLKPDYFDAFYQLGQVLEELGSHAKAVQAFDSAWRLKPDHVDLLMRLAPLALSQEAYAVAAEAYDAISRLRPDDADAMVKAGSSYVKV